MMSNYYGVILIDESEVLFHLYHKHAHELRLFTSQSALLPHTSEQNLLITLIKVLTEFFSSQTARHVADWKVAGRGLTNNKLEELSTVLGIKIDTITPSREAELLCRGLVTELL